MKDDVTPVTPEHVDEVLASVDSYETGMREDQERNLEGMLREVARKMGPDAFREATVRMFLPHEDRWRREVPNHPGLAIIDRWREDTKHRRSTP